MLNVILLISLVKLLSSTHNVRLCTGVYGGFQLFLGLLGVWSKGSSLVDGVFFGLMATLVAFLYFLILEKLDGTWLWWPIAFAGIFLQVAPALLHLV